MIGKSDRDLERFQGNRDNSRLRSRACPSKLLTVFRPGLYRISHLGAPPSIVVAFVLASGTQIIDALGRSGPSGSSRKGFGGVAKGICSDPDMDFLRVRDVDEEGDVGEETSGFGLGLLAIASE